MASDPLTIYNNHPLRIFLKEHLTDTNDASLTHTTSSLVKGKWDVDKDYDKYYDLLHDYLFIMKGKTLNIVEHPRRGKPKPLVIDLDFHYPNHSTQSRTFNKDHIFNFTKIIASTLDKFFVINGYEKLRFFITLRASKPNNKDGIHILSPDIILNDDKQKVIRNYIIKNNLLKNCFEGTGYHNTDEKVYDVSMTGKQAWYPYGESKSNIPPYLLTNVFQYCPEDTSWIEEDIANYSNRQLMELLSIRNIIHEDDNQIKEDEQEPFNILLNGRLNHVEEESVVERDEPTTLLSQLQDFITTTPSEQEKNVIQRLVLECLDAKRADDYESWMRLGWCLHNIDISDDMFNLWMEFSRKSSKFSSNNVAQLRADFFHKMRTTTDGPCLTERSLYSWAKKDNPEVYKKVIDDHIFEYIRQEVDGTHYHMAKLMKKMYKNNYVASINNRDTDWYYYDDTKNMWTHLNQGIQLKTKISTEVAAYIAQVQMKYSMRACDERISKEERDVAVTHIKRFQKMQNNLYTNGFVESTMKMAEVVFSDENFTNKLNNNTLLFSCKNGVLQLRTVTNENPNPHVIFRTGIPEDYLSFLAGYNFQETEAINYQPYNPKNPVYKEIYDFFDKIFPDTQLRDYFLRLLASCLEGANREQCYYTWEGVGGNGKSKITELMRLTFGDYQTSLQATTLTRKRPESGAANPDIIAIKNKRFVYLQEPDDKEPLNTSRMKQFSGEDMIEARGLYKDQEKFKVTGKLCMMCNSKPIIRSMDRGTWRRIRVIPFVSKFVEADDPEYISKKKNVFLRDNDLDKKLKEWREPFLSLLVHIYETQYLKTGLEPTPAIVKKASEEYKESNDSFAKFQNERIREELGAEINFKQIDRAYRKWAALLGGAARTLNSNDLLKRVNDEYGEPVDGKYYNRRVFMDEEELDSFDALK